ncbi:MAG: radical SAM protein [Polyangiaceae bacterium]
MRITFICADLEENLGVGILAAIAEEAGHRVKIVPFNDASETGEVVERALRRRPDVIGLSIQFQHRAPEFLALAQALRGAGYDGHITSGGQFPTLAWRQTLAPENGVDSVVLHDAEDSFPELLRSLEAKEDLATIPGLALRLDGEPRRTAERPLLDDLDAVPFPKRYRSHNQHMGIPFIPILGGRGCWGKCSYCSIIAFYDDAIEGAGGRKVRLRSPENVAAEMALLLENAGGQAIFCFHDDNFIFPGEKFSLKRIRAIREALDEYGVGKVAMVGKARPDCVTPALARELAELGVIRLYVGVENGSEDGGDHLRRGTQQAHVREAMKACREAGIFVCYNLLVFEPGATVADVRDNVQFIREHADHPVNFCRAEPYFGTALHLELNRDQDLGGSYLGYNYRIDDDRAELLYRICAAAFQERNFAPRGVANRYMGLGYAANVLRRFCDRDGDSEVLQRRATLLTRAISRDTADYLEKAIALAEAADLADPDAILRKTALLGLEIAAADRHWHAELDSLYDDMRAFAAGAAEVSVLRLAPTAKFHRLKRSMAVGFAVAASIAAIDGCGSDTMVVDPAPGGMGGEGGRGEGGMVVDPAPGGMGGMGAEGGAGGGMGGEGGMVVDPAPGGMGGMGGEGGQAALGPEGKRKLRLIDQWFDTSPKKVARSLELPLHQPPKPTLEARRKGDLIEVEIAGLPEQLAVTTRWEADGDVIGEGRKVCWRPGHDADRIRVAVRSRGGIAIVSRSTRVTS